MESQNHQQLSKNSVINSIEEYQMKMGKALTNEKRFDISIQYDLNKTRIVSAMERIIKTKLVCDIEVTDQFLEKVKKYTNGL